MKEWFGKVGENLSKLGPSIVENAGAVAAFIAIIAASVCIAVLAEKMINKRKGLKETQSYKTNKIVIIAVLSAIAIILNLFSFPIWFVPSFYKLDFSELPAIIGAFALGPVSGVCIEAVKILLNLMLNGTATAFVGETANFIIGCTFVIPAAIIYYNKKSRKSALLALVTGVALSAAIGACLNAWLLIPTYAKVFGMPVDVIIGMGTKKNAVVTNLTTFILLLVVPFNLIKFLLVSVITMLIYKPISHLLKRQ